MVLSPAAAHEAEVFEAFFTLTINFITAGPLNIQKFSSQKQALILAEYGDMRLVVMDKFKKIWNALGPKQILFITALVGSFFELAMVEEPQLREAGLSLYFSTLTREFISTGSFRGVETQTIDALDKVVNERLASASLTTSAKPLALPRSLSSSGMGQAQSAESFKKYLRHILKERFEKEKDVALRNHGLNFLQDMEKIVDLFTALRVLPKAHDDDRTEARLQLMQYLKQTDRQDKYVKYIHDLCAQHEESGNNVEAGLTLLLHAGLYNWTEQPIPPAGPFTTTDLAWQRKELLYFQAIDFFERGKGWEKAIDLMEELRLQYQEVFFDYEKLSNILARQARLFHSIVSEERIYPDYFFVGFYGKGFPPDIANKQYIFKGYELEHSREFQGRIVALWPGAEILTFTEAPDDDIKESLKQYLQIYTVKPASLEEIEDKERFNQRMPPSVKKFLINNDVKWFVYSKPFRKEKQKNKENEFEDLWIRNTYFTTADILPGVRRRVEVVESRIVEVSPIQNAVNSVSAKNEELKEMILKYATRDENVNINPFSMVLNGVIDAAVSGGVSMYQKAFLTPAFAASNPDVTCLINQLKSHILYQVDILAKGLGIHANVCSTDMAGLQEQLEIKYEQIKQGVEDYRSQLPADWVVPTFELPSSVSELFDSGARTNVKASVRLEISTELDRNTTIVDSGEVPTNLKSSVKKKLATKK